MRSRSVSGYIICIRFQFDSAVSWKVIFFHIFGQSALFHCTWLAYQNHQKNMLECFGMESLSDICNYYCERGRFCGYFFSLWSIFPLWKHCPPLWFKQTVKPVATLASSNREINRGCKSNRNPFFSFLRPQKSMGSILIVL